MLYPAELRAQITIALYPKIPPVSTKRLFLLAPIFPSFFGDCCVYYHELCLKGGNVMRETNDPFADLEDLIFDEDAGGPSER